MQIDLNYLLLTTSNLECFVYYEPRKELEERNCITYKCQRLQNAYLEIKRLYAMEHYSIL